MQSRQSDLVAKLRRFERDDGKLVREYKFIARDRERTYHPRFVISDESGKLRSLFLWEMTFAPNETRRLEVSYEMQMSIGVAGTSKRQGAHWFATASRESFPFDFDMDESTQKAARAKYEASHAKEWYETMEEGMRESFEYVTETGRSWAGKVERATFRVEVRGFEEYLRSRGFFEVTPKGTVLPYMVDLLVKSADERARDKLFNGRKVYVHRTIAPVPLSPGGEVTWDYLDYRPGNLIRVAYWITNVPESPDDVRILVGSLFGTKRPTREDLADLREIILAAWGVVPTRQPVRKFVEEQIWYAPCAGRKEADVDTNHKAILAALDALMPPVGTR
jgi:hypothetical protein